MDEAVTAEARGVRQSTLRTVRKEMEPEENRAVGIKPAKYKDENVYFVGKSCFGDLKKVCNK